MNDHDEKAPTTFQIPFDDETMVAVLEQALETMVPPRALIAAVVRDAFLHAKRNGLTIVCVPPGAPARSTSKH